MASFFKRGPTTFIKRIGCEQRKEILRCEYIALDLTDDTNEYGVLPIRAKNGLRRQWSWYKSLCKFLGGAALVASIIWELHQMGGVWHDFGWRILERDLDHHPHWFELSGFILLTLANLIQLWRSVRLHRIFGCVLSFLLCAGFVGLMASKCINTGHKLIIQTDVRAAGFLGFYSSTITLIGFVTLQIFYKSFAGLFAPIAPSIHSPTILPMFLIQSLAAILHTASLGLTEFKLNSTDFYDYRYPVYAILSLRCVAYVLYLLNGWGEVNILYVAQIAFKRRLHKKEMYEDRLYRRELLLNEQQNEAQVPHFEGV